ncbi:hypothetical protein [Streptomyces broussonetiae]|uniref:HTH luxR-type domain-containing protein n=1 Tax=Streptomyces broussonetiae TaxID=2686304 RepID=A0A6I6N3G8_9ACTN|nr:hypothetical protein GQF42_08865 [Streptomyces broussonetiae]
MPEALGIRVRGPSNAEFAARPVVRTKTVKSHVGAVGAKLRVPDRARAAAVAHTSGVVAPGRAEPVPLGCGTRHSPGMRPAEYDPPNTPASWKDGR